MRISRYIYLGAAWVFLAGVLTQVFLAGMVVVALRMNWLPHRDLGHILSAPLLIMLVTMYIGRLPVSIKRLTWLLFGVYFIQADVIIFLRSQAPVVSAFHPVLALVDFALALTLARRVWAVLRQSPAAVEVSPELETSISS